MIRIALFSLLVLLTGSVYGQGKPAQTKPERGRAAAKEAKTAIVAEQESAVFTFVAEHHAELGDLLKHLKEGKQAKQYERAVRDLYAASSKLSSLKKSDGDRYELELKSWKTKSRIQLLSAKLSMGENEDLKNELKQLITQQYDLRRELPRLETKRLRDRELKLSKELTDLESRRDEVIERQYQQILSSNKPKPNAKSKSEKPAKNTASP